MRYLWSIKHQVFRPGKISGAGALVAQAGILVASAVSILLCGGMPQGSLGVFLGVSAVMLIFVPPKALQPVSVWVMACVVIGAGGLALLPAMLHEAPLWRQALLADGSFGTLDRISVVPQETLFWLAILASTLVVGIYLLSQPVSPMAMLGLTSVATLFCAVYAGLSVYAEATGWKSAFDAGPSFGFFANRNHVATLLIIGALSGIGAMTSGCSKQKPLAVLCGVVGVALCTWTVLLISPSRAGVFLLVGGVVMWLAGLGRRRITPPVAITSLALLVVGFVFFVGIDNPAARRIVGEWGNSPVNAITSDYRFKVYQDALRLWSDFPLTGSGLGSYRFLYPWYADSSLTEVTTLHPESDWLLLGLEAGPLAVLGVIILLLLVSRGLLSLRGQEGWSVRWALITAATIASIHGVFDVPLHRIELGWWVMVLLCLGLGRLPAGKEIASVFPWQRGAFGILGIFIGMLAWQLVSAEWFGGRPLPPYAAKDATQRILALHKAGQIEEALNLAAEESARSPINKDLHYQRGVLALHFEGTEAEVDSAFEAARLLSPNWPRLPREMGDAWSLVDKSKAATLWLEAVQRQTKIDQGVNPGQAPGAKFFREILVDRRNDPKAIQALKPPPDFDPALHFIWLRATKDRGAHFDELAKNAAFLGRLSESEKTEFLVMWDAHGENDLKEFLESHPDWEEAAWPVRLQSLVADERYQEATKILASRFLVSLRLPPASGPFEYALEKDYVSLITARNQVAARRILNDALRSKGERRSVAHRLAAASAADAGDWSTAYNELIAHLKASGQKLPSNL